MALLGMDTAGGEGAVKAFKDASGQLRGIATTLNNAMQFQWEGDDAKKTKGEWTGNLKTNMDNLANVLDQWAAALDKHVKEQVGTSAN